MFALLLVCTVAFRQNGCLRGLFVPARKVLEKLSDRFTQLPLKSASCVLTVPHDPQEAYFIYTLSIEIDVWYVGISASSVAEEQWAQLRTYFTHGADGAGASAYETTICVG